MRILGITILVIAIIVIVGVFISCFILSSRHSRQEESNQSKTEN